MRGITTMCGLWVYRVSENGDERTSEQNSELRQTTCWECMVWWIVVLPGKTQVINSTYQHDKQNHTIHQCHYRPMAKINRFPTYKWYCTFHAVNAMKHADRLLWLRVWVINAVQHVHAVDIWHNLCKSEKTFTYLPRRTRRRTGRREVETSLQRVANPCKSISIQVYISITQICRYSISRMCFIPYLKLLDEHARLSSCTVDDSI